MNRGAYAYPILPSPAPRQARASRSLSARLARVVSRSPLGTPSPASIIALPLTARTPLRTQASITASCARTVPMSRIDVVPAHIISVSPSSALARREASSCAASSGQMRVRSHSSRGMSSAMPRKRAWQRCTCACTNPGITAHPRASMMREGASRVPSTAPTATIPAPSTSRSPLRTRSLASHVTTVPPRIHVCTARLPSMLS